MISFRVTKSAVGRDRDAGDFRKAFRKNGELQVLRPEVMPPLGYAVSLIDGKEGYSGLVEEGLKIGHHESFRRHIQKIQVTGKHLQLHSTSFVQA